MCNTYPATTLLHVGEEAVWLQSALHFFMEKSDFPAMAVKHPAGKQVFSDGPLWKPADALPGSVSHDETAPRTPRCADRVPSTVIGRCASDVGLVQGIIVRNVVVVL